MLRLIATPTRIALAGILVMAAAKPMTAQSTTDYTAESVGKLTAGPGTPSKDPGSWPQFRGPNRDAVAPDAKGLYRSWPAGGPKVLWKIEGLAVGYSGPAVHGGKVYFNDYDKSAKAWMVRCVSLADGQEIWRWSYPRLIRANHGITRSVPVVDDKHVVSLDPKCVLHGFDAASGKRLWAKDLPAEFGTVIPEWYNGQCPLVEADRVVIGIGGKDVLMAAFNKADGKPVWQTPNPDKLSMSHASVMPMTLAGIRQYVWCTLDGVIGVSADGKYLWRGPVDAESRLAWKPNTAVAPSPVGVGDDRVFMTSSYKAGSVMFKVAPAGPGQGHLLPRAIYTLTADQFASDCHTPILFQNHLFAVNGERFSCMSLDGKVVWASPEGVKFGLGSFLLADGVLYLLEGDTGKLRMIEASVTGYKELASAQVLSGHDVWAPMALINGKLVCRDLDTMVCLEVGPAAP